MQKGARYHYMGNNNRTLEQYLKELRKSCNYSQEFVASHLNITRQTYSHYETGRITPPVNSLYNLARLYGIPVENLLDLVVTYNINTDFVRPVSNLGMSDPDEVELFIEFVNDPRNYKKFQYLSHDERYFMYNYMMLDSRGQEDARDIVSTLRHRRMKKNDDMV